MTGQDAPYQVHEIPDFTLECGATLRPARVAYQTYGELNADKSNAIVYPTWYSGRHWDNEWLIGEGMALDPRRWFIIVPEHARQRAVPSPSNTPPPRDRARFPPITCSTTSSRSTGWSPRCSGSRRCRWCSAGRWERGRPTSGQSATRRWCSGSRPSAARPGPRRTTRSSWTRCGPRSPRTPTTTAAGTRRTTGRSAACARSPGSMPAGASPRRSTGTRCGGTLGFTSLEDFAVGFWEGFFLDDRDPNNLLTMLDTWWTGDIGATPGFDSVEAALASIRAQALVLAGREGPLLPA